MKPSPCILEVFVGLNLIFIACNLHLCCNGIEDATAHPQRETQSRQRREMKEKEWLDPGDMLGTDLSSFKTVIFPSSEISFFLKMH